MSTSDSATTQRRRGALAPTVAVLAVAIVAFFGFSAIWTDLLWYRSVEAQQVFTIRLTAQVGIFCAAALLTGVVVWLNMWLAFRARPRGITRSGSSTLDRYRKVMDSGSRLTIAVPTLVLAVIGGVNALPAVDTFLAWSNATSFGVSDAQFGFDASFFVFELPWWRMVAGLLQFISVVALIVAAAVHFIMGSMRTSVVQVTPTSEGQAPEVKLSNPFTRRAQAHISVLIGFILLVLAANMWLNRYAYSFSDNDSLFTGIGYTDARSRITAGIIMSVVCLLCALGFFLNARIQVWRIPVVTVALAVATALIIQVGYPGVVQQFDVRPNEPDREREYIRNQIAATRAAYDVENVEISDYEATTTATSGQLVADAEALPGIRLMDPQVISPTFEQLQQVRGYYSFPDVLDVDRYTIGGQETDAIVAVREIATEGLPEENRTWNNVHTVYTHGYAMVGAYGNRRQGSGEPEWIVSDIPPRGAINQTEARVYFGEKTSDYAIVGNEDGANPIELDTPGGNEDGGGETYTTYTGNGGVAVSNPLVRAMFAARYGDVNLLLSNRVNSQSRILYERTPMDRVAKVAPWLTTDKEPYPAVVDGRVVWIIDGYTTSNSYPNSQRIDLASATGDSTSTWTQVGQESSQVNYMRNSVKAVVDAYDGSVTMYAWDTEDPILQTWQKVYPGMLHSVDEISADLMQHLRYPQDLFKVQRQILGRYHMTNPDAWYQQSDLWNVPMDPRFKSTKEPAYYLSIKWPGDEQPVFSQTAVFVPNERENLGAYMSVVADASSEDYGKIRVLRLSDTHQVPGPNQTFNAIQTDNLVQQSLLPFTSQGAAKPVYGNLLTLPLGGGLIYVEPIYTQGETQGSYPVLRFIVVRFGDKIGIGGTLQEALDMVFGGNAGATTGEQEIDGTTTPDTPPATGEEAAKLSLAKAGDAFRAADEALRNGDLAGYQAQVETARHHLDDADKALRNG